MNKTHLFLLTMLFFSTALFSSESTGKETYIPPEVKTLVDSTFSVRATERAEAAFKLGKLGEKADKSVPFLLRMLDDNLPVWCRYNGEGTWTTPGQEASKALSQIGRPSLQYILPLLENSHPYISINEHMKKNLASALNKISGMEFGDDFVKWAEWLKSQ
ncbi:MAG: HEAT repeat domain-containing protein [Candidatus Omnitrophica bacterium]|nr:HEAT repeat domain-containing protein [Candidatus Omnitrophota bacterium]